MTSPPTTVSPPMLRCPVCGEEVPAGAFCGACGSHLHHSGAPSGRRLHAYAAAPGEHVAHLNVVSTLFPHLPHRSQTPFRVALALFVAGLVSLSLAQLQAPVIAACALGIPLLFQLYLFEVEVYQRERVVENAFVLLLGGVIGLVWSLLTSNAVSSALRPALLGGASGHHILVAVGAPAVAQVLMVVPVFLLRWSPGRRPGSVDGFNYGALGALGFVVAATFVDLGPQLRAGAITNAPVGSVLSEALIRGVAVPLFAAAATGLVGAALWARRRRPPVQAGRWITSALLALLVVVAVQAALGYAGLRLQTPAALAAVHLAAAAIALMLLRVGLHHVLLHEQQQVRVGSPHVCPECHHLVPQMPFCPHCGVAERSLSRHAQAVLAGSVAPPAPAGPAGVG